MRVISWKCFVFGNPRARMPNACLDSYIDPHHQFLGSLNIVLYRDCTNLEMPVEVFPDRQNRVYENSPQVRTSDPYLPM